MHKISNVEIAYATDGGTVICLYTKNGFSYKLGVNKKIGTISCPIYGMEESGSWKQEWEFNRSTVTKQIEEILFWMSTVKSFMAIESINENLNGEYSDIIDIKIQAIFHIINEINSIYDGDANQSLKGSA